MNIWGDGKITWKRVGDVLYLVEFRNKIVFVASFADVLLKFL